jgi:hypothetical protein
VSPVPRKLFKRDRVDSKRAGQAHHLLMAGGSAAPSGRQDSGYPAPGYVLGSSDTERQRLVRQAGGFAAEASWLLDQVGMEAGWRAVDVGCGPIGIMDLLCDRVAPRPAPAC